MQVRIGHLSTFYHTAVLLMAGNDTGRRLGADIDWRLFGTGPAIIEAFEKGELDLAYIGLPPAIIGIARGVPVVCVAGGHIEGTVISGRAGFAGMPEAGNPAGVVAQFSGHVIGVPGRGSIHDVILTELLDRYGLRNTAAVINFAWADQATEAAVKGTIDFAVGTPALAVAVRRYAGFRTLCPPSLIWPENPSYGILASRAFLEKAPQAVLGFLSLHEEATAFLRSDPREAAAVIARYVGFIESDFVLETLMVSPKYCADLSGGYIRATMEFAGCLKRLGYISREVMRDEIFDTSLIRTVHPAGDHYGSVPGRVS